MYLLIVLCVVQISARLFMERVGLLNMWAWIMVMMTLECPNSTSTFSLAIPQVSQKGLYIPSSLFLRRFLWNEISEGFRPVDIKRRTIRRDPVFQRARPVSLPKAISPFRIGDIHNFNRETLFDFEKLDNSRSFNTRRKYYIII